MNISRQIESGQLVCPKTKQKLSILHDTQWIENVDGTHRYKFMDGKVPILLTDPAWLKKYANDSERMNAEYAIQSINKRQSFLNRIKAKLTQDYRTEASKKALQALFIGLSSDAICISIGGGPTRAHPRLLNLNIGPFPNVEVVVDAHCLPYADGCVDVIHCEAVFEHLYDPVQAAKEMHRVLKPGSKAYICTPFLQAYHGYPHHYQNYTLTGHQNLFEAVGFRIVEAGVCVGPVYTIVNLIAVFLNEYIPYPVNLPVRYLWGAAGALIRPLDKILAKKKNAHVLASTTYAIVEKV
jgi:SAM-dependent methyltransferase